MVGGGGSCATFAAGAGACGLGSAIGGPTGLFGVVGTSSIGVNILKFLFSLLTDSASGVLCGIDCGMVWGIVWRPDCGAFSSMVCVMACGTDCGVV